MIVQSRQAWSSIGQCANEFQSLMEQQKGTTMEGKTVLNATAHQNLIHYAADQKQ